MGMRALRRTTTPHCDVNVERFVLRGRRVLAAPIPKVASRTIKGMVARAGGKGASFQISCSPDEIVRDFPDFFVFSFVRNPWSRIHSCWKDKIADATTPGKLLILSRFEGLRPFMPFSEFVEWLDSEHGTDEFADRHWLSQVRHLSTEAGDGICDFVGKIEAFDTDMCRVEEMTGVTFPRIAARNVKDSPQSYEEAYDERSRGIIERRYAEDMETFGYRFA